MTTVDVGRNRPLFERALRETCDAYCRQRPHRGLLIRDEALRILARGIRQTIASNARSPMFTAPQSAFFEYGRLSAGFERSIKEGNASMNRLQKLLRRTRLVKMLSEKAKILWPTAEQIVDQFILN